MKYELVFWGVPLSRIKLFFYRFQGDKFKGGGRNCYQSSYFFVCIIPFCPFPTHSCISYNIRIYEVEGSKLWILPDLLIANIKNLRTIRENFSILKWGYFSYKIFLFRTWVVIFLIFWRIMDNPEPVTKSEMKFHNIP